MLLQFSVENFRSIKDRAVLSLEGSADKENPNNFVMYGKNKYLKGAAIFGANGAGKSNIFKALTAAILTIRRSNDRQIEEPLFLIAPFLFDRKCIKQPSSFEFVFITGGIKYVYGFSATQEKIVDEYLYVYKSSKPSTIFERSETNKYRFTSTLAKKQLMPLIERNSSNKLFLATATSWNYTDTKAPFLWFLNGINTYNINDFGSLLNHVGEMYEQDTDGSLKQFTNNILHEADINIDNFIFDSREVSPEVFMQQMPPVLRGLFPINPERKNKEYTVSTIHSISNATGTEIYEMPLFEESQGTQNLFMFSPFIKQAFNTGETLCIDELDASLHPMLVIYLVELFNNTDVNKNNAQLIISSHTTSLLSLSVLRRDQIYFVEKDKKTGETSLYSLDEFSPRKSEDIRKAYLLGRYGSVPTIGGEI